MADNQQGTESSSCKKVQLHPKKTAKLHKGKKKNLVKVTPKLKDDTINAEGAKELSEAIPKFDEDKVITFFVNHVRRIAKFQCKENENFINLYSDVAQYFKMKGGFQICFKGDSISKNATPNSLGLNDHAVLELIPFTDEASARAKELEEAILKAENPIEIKFQSNDTDEKYYFDIDKFTKIKKVLTMYSEIRGIPLSNLEFEFDGEKLTGTETPDALEMQSGFCIDVWVTSPVAGSSQMNDLMFPVAGPSRMSDAMFPIAGPSRMNDEMFTGAGPSQIYYEGALNQDSDNSDDIVMLD